MISGIKSRLVKLESKEQNKNSTCFSLDYFYGQPAQPIPLIHNLSLSDFYASSPARINQHG